MRPHVKICGLKSEEMIDVVLSRGSSIVGLVCFEKSPRHLSIEDLVRLRAHVGGRALVAVVTVDPDDALLERLAERVRPDILQLHGSETSARVAEIGATTGIPVMKAVGVATVADLDAVRLHRAVADRLLLDARRPAGSVLPGGNGVSFDWDILRRLDPGTRFMLSGGLNPGNVADAVRRVRPYGLDVSSGVEREPGVKDAGLIHRLFDALDGMDFSEQQRRAS